MSGRYALCVARFYEDLACGSSRAHARHSASRASREIDVFDVPGAFELPLAALLRGRSPGATPASICLGAVIRGETDHYDWVCGEAARGIQDVQLRTGVPVGFGVLTVDTLEQALARAGGDKRDSGRHAAEAVLANVRNRELLAG